MNHTESRFWLQLKLRQISHECHIIFETQFKCVFNVKTFVKMLKILSFTENLSYIPSVQKPGLRPMALAFPNPRPGQKPAQAKGWAQLGPAFFGLAWPGFWPQAKAGTSLSWMLLWVPKNTHWVNILRTNSWHYIKWQSEWFRYLSRSKIPGPCGSWW